VSGSTAGIGFAHRCSALAAEGAKVIVNGRTEARVAAAVKKDPGGAWGILTFAAFPPTWGTAHGVETFLQQVPDADHPGQQSRNLLSPNLFSRFPIPTGSAFSK